MHNAIIKFKTHSFKERLYFKRKSNKGRDIKVTLSITKHRIELLKDANTLITDNPGTNFHLACANQCTQKLENSFSRSKKWMGCGKIC